MADTASNQRVIAICEQRWDAHAHDCSGFAKAVAQDLGVTLTGLADDIVTTLRTSPAWRKLPDGVAAAASAKAGKLVIAGLQGKEQTNPDPHGHVVVVVGGPLAHDKYPTSYWGQLGGTGAKAQTLNFAWIVEDRDRITYAETDLG